MPRQKNSGNSNGNGSGNSKRPLSGSGNGKRSPSGRGNFHIEFKNEAQGLAWAAFKQHDVLFMTGPAGVGKTFLACAFAIEQILKKEKSRIILTRPIVDAGESLGFLPGEFEDKVDPYMMPMWDCIHKLVGREGAWYDRIMNSIEIAPVAYMRGRSFADSVCIFDEAQNATRTQLKLFLTRFEEDSKVILTGDPTQSDLPGDVALSDVMRRLHGVSGIGMVEFKTLQIVRHPLIVQIIKAIGD